MSTDSLAASDQSVNADVRNAPTPFPEQYAADDDAFAVSGTSPPEEEDEWQAVDVNVLSQQQAAHPRPYIVGGLWRKRAILAVTGEEGHGKTLWAEQLCRQLLRGESAFDHFTVGEARPSCVLFVDTEMEREDARERSREMDLRGLTVPAGSMYWLNKQGMNLTTNRPDLGRLSKSIADLGVDLLWVDSAAGALGEDTNDPHMVRQFFDNMSGLMKRHDLLGIGLTLHPRKRVANEHGARPFDSMFGSREWKGRLHHALYIERDRIVCWKSRDRAIARRWQRGPGGHPTASLLRPGMESSTVPPFTISLEDPKAAAKERAHDAARALAIRLVTNEPEKYTKNTLRRRLNVGVGVADAIIADLLALGVIGPDRPHGRLRRTDPA